MMKIRCLLVSFLVLLIMGIFPAVAQVAGVKESAFFVSMSGNDSWSGRLPKPNADRTDGPFATLHAACRAARRSDVGQSRKIVIQAGRYFFDEPLVLDNRDSGLTIESAPGPKLAPAKAGVRLIGGRETAGWKEDGQTFYSVALSGVEEGQWDFRALIVNGRFCPRARLPEKGFFNHLNRFKVPWMSTTGGGWKRKPTREELTTLKYRPEDVGPWLDINNAELTIYHMWDESLVGLAAMDGESRTLTFTKPSGHPPGAFDVNKYVIWNVREGMTRPGQWYLDRTAGKLVYWPLPGENMAKAEVIAPTIESIIRIQGSRENPVRDITLRGLTLSVTTTPLETGGFGAGRYDGAVSVAFAESCRLIGLDIVNIGGQGIKASGDNLRIERCHVHHAGACGIRCRGTECIVTDNHIHDVGLTYPSAIALQGGGKDCRITHNEIHDCPYTAINCGGERNHIEHNLIYRAMEELHDGGGIYCFAGQGLVLRGNFIRDIIDTGGYGASAYYLDERSENCLVEGNLSIGIIRPSHNHMAQNNTIRNNVFISSTDARITFPKSSGYTFEKNVIHARGKIVFENPDAVTALRCNVLYSAVGSVQSRKLKGYSRGGEGSLEIGLDNELTDPIFLEYSQGRVTFAAGSPVSALGIELIDVSGAGPRPR
jgi:hypothetical protein